MVSLWDSIESSADGRRNGYDVESWTYEFLFSSVRAEVRLPPV